MCVLVDVPFVLVLGSAGVRSANSGADSNPAEVANGLRTMVQRILNRNSQNKFYWVADEKKNRWREKTPPALLAPDTGF